MNAVIIFSHGSLLCGAGIALSGHAERLRASCLAPIVEVGYLNYSEPLFIETVAKCVSAGATKIIVTPYFLIPGYFVKVDLPKAVSAAKEAFPAISFVVAEALGFDDRLADALIQSAIHAKDSRFWREEIISASESCRPSPACPLYNTSSCPKKTGELTFGAARSMPFSVKSSSTEKIPDNPKQALLVMVHGSPRPIANQEMFKVVEAIKSRKLFHFVQVGFMECNELDIPSAIEACISNGAAEIVAVPYFLHTGTHVADDLPSLLEEGEARFPNVMFRMGEFLGKSELLTDILRDRTALYLNCPEESR